MAKLIREFLDFNDDIKIDTEAETLREKRDKLKQDFKDYFPSECSEYGISVTASSMEFINQGSYKIGTTIKNPNGNIDLDLAVIFPLDKDVHTDPRQVKKAAREALLIKNVREPRIKEPCVTVGYHSNGVEKMHIDFPLYAKKDDKLYLARGKETSDDYEWEKADPKGLSEYFLEEFKLKEQLRRIVRYLKKWKQIKYKNSTNSHEIPPSIALTILACRNFVSAKDGDRDYDLKALYETLSAIKNQFVPMEYNGDYTIKRVDITCDLPVIPYTDVLYKMRKSDSHLVTLYNRLSTAVSNLKEAVELSSEHEAGVCVQKVLGEDFTVPEKEAKASAYVGPKEHNFGE